MPPTITTFEENAGSRRGNTQQSTRDFTIAGNTSGTPLTEAELSAYLLSQIGVSPSLPTTLCGFKISDASYNESPSIPGQYDVTVNWDIPTEIGYRFNFQAQGGHFVQSLSTISAWGKGGVSLTTQPLALDANHLPNFGGAINVVPQEDGSPKVEGADVAPPPEIFSLTYHAYDDVVTTAYQLKIQNLCGKVNSVTWNGLDAGTTMLVRVSGERKLSPIGGHVWQIEFGFGYVPNLAAPLYIGDGLSSADQIQVLAKDGLDLLWIWRNHEKQDAYGILRAMPIAAYVERVWPRADLNDLALPGF